MYEQCPLKWSLVYKDGHKIFSPSIHLIFGTSFHETFQEYLKLFYETSGVEADKLDLEEMFQEKLSALYKKEYDRNNKTHFSSSEELGEFYEDGISILNYLKKKRGEYFSKRNWHLIGIEMPLMIKPLSKHSLYFKGFIDIVLYHEPTEEFLIIDFKTSKSGWYDKDKKDDIKKAQLILYREYFSKQYGIDPKKVKIEFFIVKRKLWEECEFPQKRVQSFTPPSGKNKTTKSVNMLENFIEKCFNQNGTHKEVEHKGKINEYCKYCPFQNTNKCPTTYKG